MDGVTIVEDELLIFFLIKSRTLDQNNIVKLCVAELLKCQAGFLTRLGLSWRDRGNVLPSRENTQGTSVRGALCRETRVDFPSRPRIIVLCCMFNVVSLLYGLCC